MQGTIILVDHIKGGFFTKGIRFFTKREAKRLGVRTWTHAMFGVDKFYDVESVYSAELAMAVMPIARFRTDHFAYEEYKIKDNLSNATVEAIIRDLYEKGAGNDYGLLQNLWFMYRWVMEFFGKDVRKQGNWFPDNENCSEDTARYIYQRFNLNPKARKYEFIIKKLDEWNVNNIHPVDLAGIIKQNPHLFELVKSWGEK